MWLSEESIYPIIKRRRKTSLPLEGELRELKAVNDVNDPENQRRLHGTDPLKDGWDPGEDPVRAYRRVRLRTPFPY